MVKSNFKFNVLIVSSANDKSSDILNALPGFTFLNSYSFLETIDKFSSNHPDIVFIDDDMVRFDTDSLVKEILKIDNTASCIILSSDSCQGRIIKARSNGAFSYILKPFSESKIHSCIKQIMELQY